MDGKKLKQRDSFAYLGGAICGVNSSPFSKNGKPLGCGLDVGVGVQLTKGKGNLLYSAVSIPQKNVSTYKVSPCNLCCAVWYTGSLTSLPNNFKKVEKLKTMAYPFLWNSKPVALKRESLLNTFADGGLNIVDIRTKI